MKYLSFALAACLALASCSATKPLPQYTEAQKAAQRQAIGYWQPDTTATAPKLSPVAQAKLDAKRHRGQVPALAAAEDNPRPLDEPLALPPAAPQPGRSVAFWQKLNPFRSKQPAAASPLSPLSLEGGAGGGVPHKCKGCTFIIGDNTTLAGKKAQVAAGDGATASVVEKKAGPAQVASDSSTLNTLTGGGNLAAVQGDGNTLPQTTTTQQAADWRATLAKPAGAVLAGALTVALVGGCIFLIAAYRRRKQLLNNG
jgi:hypothetical protein